MPALRSPRVRTRLTNPNAPPPEPAVALVYAPTTAAARPPAPTGKGFHRATDTEQITYFDGELWRPVTVRAAGLVEVSGGDFVSPARAATVIVEEALGQSLEGTQPGAVFVHDGSGGIEVCSDDVAAFLAAVDAAGARAALAVYSTTQVDNALSLLAGGVAAKPNIQAATAGPIANLTAVTLASVFSGYTPVAGDRVLVKNNASPDGVAAVSNVHNGWYLVGTVGGGVAPLARVSDANASAEFVGVTTCIVAQGSLAGRQYKTAQPATFALGADPITFTEIPATPLGSATPQPLGAASSGTSGAAAHDDHVHAMPSASDVGAVPVSVLSVDGDLFAQLAGAPARLPVGSNNQVLTVVAGLPAWAAIPAGEVRGSGTLAARPATPATGDTYEVTSGAALGDRYACFVAGAWVLVSYSRVRLDETPYHWWKLLDASGGAVDAGSAGTNLSEAGSGSTLSYAAPMVVSDGVRFLGGTGSKRFQSAVGAGVALTTTATLSLWVRPSAVSGTQTVFALETNQGSNAQPYYSLAVSIVNGTLRGWLTTTSQASSGQSASGGEVMAGALHLIGVTFGASTLTVWCDGVAVATLGTVGATLFTAGSSERWTLSDASGPGERYLGRAADARVYDNVAKAKAWWEETFRRGVGSYLGQ